MPKNIKYTMINMGDKIEVKFQYDPGGIKSTILKHAFFVKTGTSEEEIQKKIKALLKFKEDKEYQKQNQCISKEFTIDD